MLRKLLCLFILAGLSGCRLDVTQSIDVTNSGSEVITYSETFDDEAFMATTQLGGPNAFAFDTAKQLGWDVSGSAGPNQHTFVWRRSFSNSEDIAMQLARLAHDSAVTTPADAFLLGPTAFIGLPLMSSTAMPTSTVIPALLRPSETPSKGAGKDPAFRFANARVNAAAVDTVVHVHIEIHDAAGIHRIDPSFAEPTESTSLSGKGLRIGSPWPISRVLGLWSSVGPYGVFDFEHSSPPLCHDEPKFRKGWMYGVGVYANGAQITESLMDSSGTLAAKWLADHPVKCP